MAKLDENAVKVLTGKNLVFLATVNRDGSPQVTPTWVDTDGEYILVNTAMGRLKQKNVSRDPRVAVSAVSADNPYSQVTARGRVVEQITGKLADDHIDKMAKKYTGAEKYSRRNPEEKRVLFRILPERVISR